jgi:hypothetical protein
VVPFSFAGDPFGNRFVILDLSKGLLKTDANRNVIE